MRWPRIDLEAQDLSGFNGQKIAGSKVLDGYCNPAQKQGSEREIGRYRERGGAVRVC
jgi:hypothetical protein